MASRTMRARPYTCTPRCVSSMTCGRRLDRTTSIDGPGRTIPNCRVRFSMTARRRAGSADHRPRRSWGPPVRAMPSAATRPGTPRPPAWRRSGPPRSGRCLRRVRRECTKPAGLARRHSRKPAAGPAAALRRSAAELGARWPGPHRSIDRSTTPTRAPERYAAAISSDRLRLRALSKTFVARRRAEHDDHPRNKSSFPV